MKRLPPRTIVTLGIDVIILAACFLHIPSLVQRPRIPFEVVEDDGGVRIEKTLDDLAAGNVRPGDIITGWNGQRVSSTGLIEFLTDGRSIGDGILLHYKRGESDQSSLIMLIPHYGLSHVIIFTFVGILTWCIALLVLIWRPDDFAATILHWSMVSLATVVMIAWEGVSPHGLLPYYLSSILFFASYAGVAATFVHFTTMFPKLKPAPVRPLLIYSPVSILLLILLASHVRAVFSTGPEGLAAFLRYFDLFRVFVLIYIAVGIINFGRSSLRTGSQEEKRKLQWILFGLCIGPTPFFLFTLLPNLVGVSWIVPEQYTLAFLLAIPVTFSISFIKYHLLDVELVISRTTAYAIVIGAVALVYAFVVAFIAALVGSATGGVYAVGAILIGLLFEPLRRRVHRFVDRSFFRVRYDYRDAERKFVEEIKKTTQVSRLARLIVEQTSAVIPVERIGFFVLKQPGNRLTTQAQINFDLFERYSVRFEAEKLRTELQLPVAIDGLVEPGIRFEPADAAVFRRWEMAIVFPMLSESREFLGFLVLGKKKSGRRFSGEDVDLLNTVAAQAGLAIERITLQKKLLLKEAEADQLAELNQLKSDFVSYVSHELRTPLTSIKLFAELLRERNNNDSKSKNYIGSIIGEANRLDRMVTAILDSAKIDHGVKEYTLVPCDLGEIASGVMSIMSYQLTKQRFRVAFRRPKRPLPVRADPDAVAMALMNLISNAIKYSGEHKRLQIILRRSNSDVVCKVQDRGRGIPEDAIPHLFKKFYRQSVQANDPGGFGLGLSLVKHIMDAHAGRVTVESRAARGSTFTLHFPLDPIQGVTTKVKNRC